MPVLTSEQQAKKPKQRKLRNAEYYDMESTFDKLYQHISKGLHVHDGKLEMVKYVARPPQQEKREPQGRGDEEDGQREERALRWRVPAE